MVCFNYVFIVTSSWYLHMYNILLIFYACIYVFACLWLSNHEKWSFTCVSQKIFMHVSIQVFQGRPKTLCFILFICCTSCANSCFIYVDSLNQFFEFFEFWFSTCWLMCWMCRLMTCSGRHMHPTFWLITRFMSFFSFFLHTCIHLHTSSFLLVYWKFSFIINYSTIPLIFLYHISSNTPITNISLSLLIQSSLSFIIIVFPLLKAYSSHFSNHTQVLQTLNLHLFLGFIVIFVCLSISFSGFGLWVLIYPSNNFIPPSQILSNTWRANSFWNFLHGVKDCKKQEWFQG